MEDYVRFVLDDAFLTRLLKQTRHDLAAACSELLGSARYPARDTQEDVGTEITTDAEATRVDAWDVCVASLERTKQSLRSLEEFGKVESPAIAAKFESLRYQLYTLEKALAITDESQRRLEQVTLCTLIDGQASEEDFTAIVEKLVAAGVGMIQLRDKQLDDRELLDRAKLLTSLTTRDARRTTLCIINDRADIAAASGADGVHVGQDDLSVKDARAIVGPRKLIGVSTHAIDQARQRGTRRSKLPGCRPDVPLDHKKL